MIRFQHQFFRTEGNFHTRHHLGHMNQIQLNELKSHLWGSANILRGSIDSSDFKNYIFGLLFFKRLSDVFDEKYVELVATVGEELTKTKDFCTSFYRPKPVIMGWPRTLISTKKRPGRKLKPDWTTWPASTVSPTTGFISATRKPAGAVVQPKITSA